ncbi:MAG: hypothetical protein J5841_05390 [Clostridia bacterium]|nr:hypothetical protein [Clostridia bacterium]
MSNRTKLLACLLLCLVLVAACAAALGASVTQYPLWIGETQVTSENCNNPDTNHWRYDPASHILTLKDYEYSGLGYQYTTDRYAAIYYNGADNLTILLDGTNSIIQSRDWAYEEDHVIRSDNADCTVTIAGTGRLDITMADTWGGPALFCRGSLVFSSGSVKSLGGSCGISASAITIKKEITSVEANGFLDSAKAFTGKVITEVAGMGYDRWNRPTDISVEAAGTALNYKSAGFPVEQFDFVYLPNGGTGRMDSVREYEGGKVVLQECAFEPPMGTTFSHWEVHGVDLIGIPGTPVVLVRSCANNGIITATAKWTEASAAGITTAPEGLEYTYTGSALGLVTAGKAENGVMQYALGTDAENAPVYGWSTEIPTGVDAKTYYVWYRAVGDKTHSNTEKHCITAVIRKKQVSVTAKSQTIREDSIPESGIDFAELSGAVSGHTLNAVTITAVSGKLTPSSARILNYREQDVTDNYAITYVPGDLVILSQICVKVTFSVVNGEWNNGGSGDLEVILTGHEGDTLKLQAAQIPAAGAKPAASCKAGSWNLTPDTETAITKDTAYVYTYAEDPVYSVTVQGNNHIPGSGKDTVFTVKRSIRDAATFDSFVNVSVDGSPVGEGNYLKTAGSLILTLKAAYLDTLSSGDHKIVVTFTDGKAETTLAIASRPVPHTGDSAQPAVWIGLLLLSLLGLFVVTAALKASRKK